MSEWRGLHNPERHAPTSVTDMAWCNVCDGPCYSPEACHCCSAAEVERLTAERQEVRRLAVEWAHQPTDYDDDTEMQIMCGRAILRAMGETLPPHWTDGGLEGPIGLTP